MADAYEVVAAVQTSELIGGTQVRDVQQVTVMAKPSGVTFPVRIPVDVFGPAAVHAAAEPIAEALNVLKADPRVASVTVSQDADAGGMLVDTANVTVLSTSGTLTAGVSIPLAAIAADEAEAEVAAAVANLDAVAGL